MNVTVPDALAGERLDRIVALEADVTRTVATDMVTSGAVTLNGRVVTKGSTRVAGGDVITAEVAALADVGIVPEPDVAFSVVYEDDDIVVIDKPAGLVVHPGAGRDRGTLVHGLVARYPEIALVGEPERPGIVHRLDAGTSGLMVVARTERARQELVEMLGAREVARQYCALAWGVIEGDEGLIDAPIGRSERERTKMAIVADGREARTRFYVRARFTSPAPVTLLECHLETGRTHQIRVHLASIKHPVVGDTRYGRARPAIPCARPFLHAERLAFAHPITGEELAFDSALPADLAAVLARLS
ncbi:MAG TPA: RluA family pseudouridine synthase [Acidimicrobiales bacterium]|nr:RluA family pseudouridine synthase [Acidimicrobiales bacterium]